MISVFISYRRDDAGGHAGRLADRLVARFGAARVFMDVEDIQPGQNFQQTIEQTIAKCDHMIAVVGPRWLQILQARADRGEDFVRHEISVALARGTTVIPVLVGGAAMPAAEQLPPALAAFSRCQAVEVRDHHFDGDAARIVDFLATGIAGGAHLNLFGWRIPRHAFLLLLPALLALLAIGWLVWPEAAPANVASGVVAPAAGAPRVMPSLSYGTWTLRNARDEQGKRWDNSVLQFTSQEESSDGLIVRGRFTWRLDNMLMGTEEVSGRYVDRTRQVILEGSTVTDAAHDRLERLAVGSYSAVLTDDERSLVRGRWGSTADNEAGFAGEWEAMR
jgi:hypothetical protein